MTTQRQIEANRANAKASTGPRSSEGRRRSAQNASTHGATRRPDIETISAFYRAISAREYPALSDGRFDQTGWDLATSEAQLDHVRRVEEQCLREIKKEADIQSDSEPRTDDEDFVEEVIKYSENKGITHEIKRDPDQAHRILRYRYARLANYRAEAEARRTSALRRWIKEQEISKTKPIST